MTISHKFSHPKMPSLALVVFTFFSIVSFQALAIGAKPPASSRPLDAILVTVGDEIILTSDLQKAIRLASNNQSTLDPSGKLSGGSIQPSDAQNILDTLIEQRIITIKARELGLVVTDEELTAEIEAFLKNQNVTQEKLLESLRAQGDTLDSYREEFRRQLETQRIIGKVVRPTVSVTDDDVRSFYLQQPGIADKQQRVKLKSLMINLGSSVSDTVIAERKQNISRIEKEVRDTTDVANLDFDKLVKLYSNDPNAMKGGLLPPRELKDLPSEVRSQLTSTLKAGSVIGPIALGSSVFFFQYLGTALNNENEYEKQKAQWKNMLLEAKGNERLAEFVRGERTKTKIEKRDFEIKK
jgi:peptidyl-prolyl cis-trans isomerase SurA